MWTRLAPRRPAQHRHNREAPLTETHHVYLCLETIADIPSRPIRTVAEHRGRSRPRRAEPPTLEIVYREGE